MSKASEKGEKLRQAALKYRDELGHDEKLRYEGKLKLIDNEDPYDMPTSAWSEDESLLPSVTYPDIVNYLVFSPSPYSSEDLKSYKGLDAYNQFVCGWVREKMSRVVNDNCLTKAKVLHSQRMSEKPLQPWVVAERTGRILAAHCTCMAGLGEACSHIAALLFSIEATVKLRDAKTVTEEKSYWLLPNSLKGVTYKKCSEIDFTSAKSLKKKLDTKITACSGHQAEVIPEKTASKKWTPEPKQDELSHFFSALNLCESKPAILSIVPEFSDSYIPQPVKENFPTVLSELRDDEALCMNYSELLKKCQKFELIVSEEQAKAVESATREQSKSRLWHRFRTGRITASKMKNVCNTDPTFPSQSLIKSICYPESYKFKSAATQWGCQHEKYAREIFFEKVKTVHENAKLEESGFFINPVVPFIGASPDGIFSCDCCGQATVEIKCPFCKRESTFDSAMSTDKKFYLQEQTDKGQLTLDKNHLYYYQVQTQLGVTKLDLAYFVVWTEKDLHIEQITFDSEMWNEMCAKSRHIFVTAILPELIGKFYSRLPNTNSLSASACSSSRSGESETSSCNTNDEFWCFCNQVESGRMICCDNDKCKLKWFHYLCLGISCAPRGKWYCPDCRKLSQFQSKRGKKPAK